MIIPSLQTTVVMSYCFHEEIETRSGLRVGNEGDAEECIRSVHCAGNCVYNIYNTGKKTRCGLRVGISNETNIRSCVRVGNTEDAEECIQSVNCAGNYVSNLHNEGKTSRVGHRVGIGLIYSDIF